MRQGTSLASSLVRDSGGRLFGVFWGSLVVVDLAAVSHAPSALGVGGVAVVVALGSWRQTTWTMVAAASMGWLFVNGFVVNHLGQLGWDGLPDLWRLLLLTAVAWAAARAGNLDGFLTRASGWRDVTRVASHRAAGHPGTSLDEEKDAVGR